MAWVNRTSRENNRAGLGACSTEGLGPGSYDSMSGIAKKGPGYAPFGSTNIRSIGDTASLVTPGPGSYASQTSLSKPGNVAAAAFHSKSRRSNESSTGFTTPGPGAYGQKARFDTPKKKAWQKYGTRKT